MWRRLGVLLLGVAPFGCSDGDVEVDVGGDSSRSRYLAIASAHELTLVDYGNPTEPRLMPLTDDLWPGGAAWSPNGSMLAWATFESSYGAVIDGVFDPGKSLVADADGYTPGVYWLDETTLLAGNPNTGAPARLWQPRADASSPLSGVRAASGVGRVTCSGDSYTFSSANVARVSWRDNWQYFLHPNGERLALVVPPEDAGRTPASPLVDVIVGEGVSRGAASCHGFAGQDVSRRIEGIAWSASTARLAVESWGVNGTLLVGVSPLSLDGPGIDALSVAPASFRSWFFEGETLFWVEKGGGAEDESLTRLRKLVPGEPPHTVGVAAPGEVLLHAVLVPGEPIAVLAAVRPHDPGQPVVAYYLDEAESLHRLGGSFSLFAWRSNLFPQPGGNGLAALRADSCNVTEGTCTNAKTLVWLDPQHAPEPSFELDGAGDWTPDGDGLLLLDAGKVFFTRASNPKKQYRLGSGDKLIVPPALQK